MGWGGVLLCSMTHLQVASHSRDGHRLEEVRGVVDAPLQATRALHNIQGQVHVRAAEGHLLAQPHTRHCACMRSDATSSSGVQLLHCLTGSSYNQTSRHEQSSTSMVCCSSPSKRASWSKLASCSTHMTWKSGEYAALRGTAAACTTCVKGRSALSSAPRTTALARDRSSLKLGDPARGTARSLGALCKSSTLGETCGSGLSLSFHLDLPSLMCTCVVKGPAQCMGMADLKGQCAGPQC